MTSVLLSCRIPCLYGRLSTRVTSNVVCAVRNFTEHKPTANGKGKKMRFPGFKPIYASDDIKIISALNSVKHKHKNFCSVIIPFGCCAHILNVISAEVLYPFVSVCCISLLGFYITGNVGRYMIAFVYYKKDKQEVVLSYVTDTGTREDLRMFVHDIVPINFTQRKLTDPLYKEVNVKNLEMPLKLNVSGGHIVDKEAFHHIFGDYE